MKLIDTSAWIEYYRDKGKIDYKKAISKAIEKNEAAVCGIIKTELLVHTRSKKEYDLLESDMSGIYWLETDYRVFAKAAETGFHLKRKGITIPLPDLIITACAITYKCPVIHYDKHYNEISRYLSLKTISFDL